MQGREKPEIAEDNISHAYFFISNSHKMKKLTLSALMLLFVVSTIAQTHRHYSYQGGHYKNGRGSSHKGGSYKNRRTGNHYTHHRN